MAFAKTMTITAAAFMLAGAPAIAQTTLGGNSKDNSASGGSEAGRASASGTSNGAMTKSGGSMSGPASASTDNKASATGGNAGGAAGRN